VLTETKEKKESTLEFMIFRAFQRTCQKGPKWAIKRKNLPESRSWWEKKGKKVRILPHFASIQ